MKLEKLQFSVRRMLLAIACLAATLSASLHFLYSTGELTGIASLIMAGTSVGGIFGALFGRFWRRVAIALAVSLIFLIFGCCIGVAKMEA